MRGETTHSTGPRIPYERRTNWQEKMHYSYGAKNHLHDIDMFIEHKSGEIAALVEFKNAGELIEMYKYNQFINLANKAQIPAYICVGYEHLGPSYYIIPLNDIARKIPWLDKPRFFNERNYIQFLHYIKGIKVDPKDLVGKSTHTPKESEAPLPFVVGAK